MTAVVPCFLIFIQQSSDLISIYIEDTHGNQSVFRKAITDACLLREWIWRTRKEKRWPGARDLVYSCNLRDNPAVINILFSVQGVCPCQMGPGIVGFHVEIIPKFILLRITGMGIEQKR